MKFDLDQNNQVKKALPSENRMVWPPWGVSQMRPRETTCGIKLSEKLSEKLNHFAIHAWLRMLDYHPCWILKSNVKRKIEWKIESFGPRVHKDTLDDGWGLFLWPCPVCIKNCFQFLSMVNIVYYRKRQPAKMNKKACLDKLGLGIVLNYNINILNLLMWLSERVGASAFMPKMALPFTL